MMKIKFGFPGACDFEPSDNTLSNSAITAMHRTTIFSTTPDPRAWQKWNVVLCGLLRHGVAEDSLCTSETDFFNTL